MAEAPDAPASHPLTTGTSPDYRHIGPLPPRRGTSLAAATILLEQAGTIATQRYAGEVAPSELSLRQGVGMDLQAQTVVVTAADGRRLDVVTAGPAGGLAFVFHTGAPVGLVTFPPMIKAAAARGLRTILYARPGYAGSTPRPGRTVADAAGDVAAILDALGDAQFVTAGWSGGGPHALACAARLPGRCRAAATIAGVAPYQAAGLDWLAGMARRTSRSSTPPWPGRLR